MKGFYQSTKNIDDYFVQISIWKDDSTFVEYIDNREVDRGTYEKVKKNVYKLKSEKQNFEITLNKGRSFEIIVKKLNGGKPIIMEKIDTVPTNFPQRFNDVDEYRSLLD